MGARSAIIAVLAVAACHHAVPPAVPGQTRISVSAVDIAPRQGRAAGRRLQAAAARARATRSEPNFPERRFNEFRLADRRRIVAYLQGLGRFDAEVDEPELTCTRRIDKSVAVTWRVHEGAAYRIASVEIVGAPAGARRDAARDGAVRAGRSRRPRDVPAAAPRARGAPAGRGLRPRARLQPHVRRSRREDGRVVLLPRSGTADAHRVDRRSRATTRCPRTTILERAGLDAGSAVLDRGQARAPSSRCSTPARSRRRSC